MTLLPDGRGRFTGPIALGGTSAAGIFVLMLLAFVVESQLAQYVQTTQDFRQPFFLFYIAHSSFFVIFPLHLLVLVVFTKKPVGVYLHGISAALKMHLSQPSARSPKDVRGTAFPAAKFAFLVGWLTAGVTVPGLLWFVAITLASVSDVTALWNSNAFWAYVISVKLQKQPWEPRRLASVIIASVGVLAVVYGSENPPPPEDVVSRSFTTKPTAPLIGNTLTLLASIGYGLYQVMYKRHAALSYEPEVDPSHWERLSISYESLSDTLETATENEDNDMAYPPPFGLHANLLTSLIGLCTLCVMWIPIPVLDYLRLETFKLPSGWPAIFTIIGIAASGVVFNASFMILLGVWGPIITSVGNLLTIVLVLLSDVIVSGASEALTFWSLLGSGMIVCAFGVLVYEMFRP